MKAEPWRIDAFANDKCFVMLIILIMTLFKIVYPHLCQALLKRIFMDLLIYYPQQLFEVASIIIAILYMRKLKQR